MPILGFTPVCTMAKELAVALASNHLTKQRTSRLTPSLQLGNLGRSTKANVTLGKSGLSQSVPPFIVHLRMFSDSGTISPGPGWPDWEIEKLRMRIILP